MAVGSIVAAVTGALLYRLRGGLLTEFAGAVGWLWGTKQRTQLMRLLWCIPTAALFLEALDLDPLVALALVASTFVGLAALGHGAHMIYDRQRFIIWSNPKTELITRYWLPAAFGGIPDASWPTDRVDAYNMAGMSAIGLARNLITVAPLFYFGETTAAIVYAASGLLHGPLYWAGWKLKPTQDSGEYLVGALSWLLIFNL